MAYKVDRKEKKFFHSLFWFVFWLSISVVGAFILEYEHTIKNDIGFGIVVVGLILCGRMLYSPLEDSNYYKTKEKKDD